MEGLEEDFRSCYETVTQCNICFPLRLFAWVLRGKLRGHEDMVDDRTQNVIIEVIGSGDGHDC
jgi:hypothetical protein